MIGGSLSGAYYEVPTLVTVTNTVDTLGAVRRVQSNPISRISYIEGIEETEFGPIPGYLRIITSEGYREVVDYCLIKDCSFDILSSTDDQPLLEVEVFPNPTDDFLHLTGLYVFGVRRVTGTLHDGYGRTVRRFAVETQDRFTLNWSQLSAGIYHLILRNADGEAREKIVAR